MRGLCCWLGCDDAVAEAVRLGQFVRRHARRRALLDAAGRSTLQMEEEMDHRVPQSGRNTAGMRQD